MSHAYQQCEKCGSDHHTQHDKRQARHREIHAAAHALIEWPEHQVGTHRKGDEEHGYRQHHYIPCGAEAGGIGNVQQFIGRKQSDHTHQQRKDPELQPEHAGQDQRNQDESSDDPFHACA